MAGFETDPDLKTKKPIRHSILHARSYNRIEYGLAKEAVPKQGADWEIAEFLRLASRCVLWELGFVAIRNYAQFDFLFRRIFREESRPYLPAVFAASVWSPKLDGPSAAALLTTMPDREHDKLFTY